MATANYAIHLDGVNMHYSIADDVSHDYATGNAFTFGMWLKRDADDDSARTRSYLFSREGQHEAYIENDELIYYINLKTVAVTWRTGIQLAKDHTHLVVFTGAEVSGASTLKIYIDGLLKGTLANASNAMPDDVAKSLFVGSDFGTTAGYYLKGTLSGWFQSNTTAIPASAVTTAWNNGTYDIDTTEAVTGLVDSIGMEENTGTSYDNALNAGLDGAGQNTPVWFDVINPMDGNSYRKNFTGVGQNTRQKVIVNKFRLDGEDIADASEVKVTDWAGNVVWNEFVVTADTGIEKRLFGRQQCIEGLKVVTLGAGTLIVELL